MKNIIVIGASSSQQSINQQLAHFSAKQLKDVEINLIDISKFTSIPIFSIDFEAEHGAPQEIIELNTQFKTADGFIISFAEHNGSYAVGYKNIIDWISRQDGKVFNQKPMLLLSTSPGGRGGATVLNEAKNYYPHMGGQIVGSFSLPKFYDFFKNNTIENRELKLELDKEISNFQSSI